MKLSLLLQAEFGLRREESIKFQPGYAIRGDVLASEGVVDEGRVGAGGFRSGTAGQRWVLEQVKNLAGKGSLIPEERTYIQQVKVYEGELRKAGISRAHGLRHTYAQRRYEDLAGWKSPHAAGRSRRFDPRAAGHPTRAVRLAISAEMGHAREEITAVYLGR